MPDRIRVLLVDDDPLVRTALTWLIEGAEDVEIVAEADDGGTAVEAALLHRPDVVLMDLRLPTVDGVTATARIRSVAHPPEVVVLTTWDVDDAVIRALDAGASGFLLKSASPEEILQAIRAVTSGDAVLSPRSTRRLLDQRRHDASLGLRRRARELVATLSPRERDVAAQLVLGRTNAEVAETLFVSEGTVKAHLSTIQMKLGVDNRTEIAVIADRADLRPSG